MSKVAIVGSRNFSDYLLLKATLDKLDFVPTEIISGGAIGADSLGERYAKEHNIVTNIFLPNWAEHGKKAGFLRNSDIVEASDLVIAFWDSESKGTLDSINKAKKLGKDVQVVLFGDAASAASNKKRKSGISEEPASKRTKSFENYFV